MLRHLNRPGIKITAFVILSLFALPAFAEEKKGSPECKEHHRPEDDPTVELKPEAQCKQNQSYVAAVAQEVKQGKELCEDTVDQLAQLKLQYDTIKAKGMSNAFAVRQQVGQLDGASDTQLIDAAKNANATAVQSAQEQLRFIERLEGRYRRIEEALAKQVEDYKKLENKGRGFDYADHEAGGSGSGGRCKGDREFYAGFVSVLARELNSQRKKSERYMADMQKNKVNQMKVLTATNGNLDRLKKTKNAMESANGNADDSTLGRIGSSVGNFFNNDNWNPISNCSDPKNCPGYDGPNRTKMTAEEQAAYDKLTKQSYDNPGPSTNSSFDESAFTNMAGGILDEALNKDKDKKPEQLLTEQKPPEETPQQVVAPTTTENNTDIAKADPKIDPNDPRYFQGRVDPHNKDVQGKDYKEPMTKTERDGMIERLSKGDEADQKMAEALKAAQSDPEKARQIQIAIANTREQTDQKGSFVVDGEFKGRSFRETDNFWSKREGESQADYDKRKGAFVQNLRNQGVDVPEFTAASTASSTASASASASSSLPERDLFENETGGPGGLTEHKATNRDYVKEARETPPEKRTPDQVAVLDVAGNESRAKPAQHVPQHDLFADETSGPGGKVSQSFQGAGLATINADGTTTRNGKPFDPKVGTTGEYKNQGGILVGPNGPVAEYAADHPLRNMDHSMEVGPDGRAKLKTNGTGASSAAAGQVSWDEETAGPSGLTQRSAVAPEDLADYKATTRAIDKHGNVTNLNGEHLGKMDNPGGLEVTQRKNGDTYDSKGRMIARGETDSDGNRIITMTENAGKTSGMVAAVTSGKKDGSDRDYVKEARDTPPEKRTPDQVAVLDVDDIQNGRAPASARSAPPAKETDLERDQRLRREAEERVAQADRRGSAPSSDAEAARQERNRQIAEAQRTPASKRTPEQVAALEDWNRSNTFAQAGGTANDAAPDYSKLEAEYHAAQKKAESCYVNCGKEKAALAAAEGNLKQASDKYTYVGEKQTIMLTKTNCSSPYYTKDIRFKEACSNFGY